MYYVWYVISKYWATATTYNLKFKHLQVNNKLEIVFEKYFEMCLFQPVALVTFTEYQPFLLLKLLLTIKRRRTVWTTGKKRPNPNYFGLSKLEIQALRLWHLTFFLSEHLFTVASPFPLWLSACLSWFISVKIIHENWHRNGDWTSQFFDAFWHIYHHHHSDCPCRKCSRVALIVL